MTGDKLEYRINVTTAFLVLLFCNQHYRRAQIGIDVLGFQANGLLECLGAGCKFGTLAMQFAFHYPNFSRLGESLYHRIDLFCGDIGLPIQQCRASLPQHCRLGIGVELQSLAVFCIRLDVFAQTHIGVTLQGKQRRSGLSRGDCVRL